MAKKGAIYERELKGILAGEEKTIKNMSKGMSEEERKSYESMIEKPFLVLRAAGSFGIDLIAIRHDYSFPIEVKSSKDKTLRFTENRGRGQKQAEDIVKECSRAGVIALYAYRLKSYRGDPWRIFTLPMNSEFEGWARYVYDILPKISLTREGNYIMHWEEGMPLSRFISYLNYEEE